VFLIVSTTSQADPTKLRVNEELLQNTDQGQPETKNTSWSRLR